MKKLLLSILLISATCYSQTFEGYPTATPSLINPTNFIKFNNKLFYFARNASFLTGLYATDGTATGNELIFSLGFVSTPLSGNEAYTEKKIIYNNELYFLLNDNLYKTNGTTAGTVIVKQGIQTAKYLFEYNSKLYFTGFSSGMGIELWQSDGSTAGTIVIKDINPGTGNAFNTTAGFDPHFTLFNSKMFFVANDGATGYELWSTDGTASGTSLFMDIRLPTQENNIQGNPDGFGAFWIGFSTDYYSKTPFKVANNKMYFVANRMINYGVASTNDQFILYSTDGTSIGTNYVVVPVPVDGIPENDFLSNTTSNYIGLNEFNNELYINNANVRYYSTPALKVGIYKISSTNTLSRVANFFIPNFGARGNSIDAQLGEMYKMNDEFYFLGINPSSTSNNLHLYKLNPATEAFTQLTTTIDNSSSDYIRYLLAKVVDDQLYFYKDEPDQVFVTNGTSAGTSQLARATQNNTTVLSDENITSDVLGMSDFNNSLYFNAGISFGQNSLYRIFNQPLSISENETIDFKLYPNPANSVINILHEKYLNNANLKIISITGQIVLEKQNLEGNDFSFDVSMISQGVYLIQLTNGNEIYNSKFIKN